MYIKDTFKWNLNSLLCYSTLKDLLNISYFLIVNFLYLLYKITLKFSNLVTIRFIKINVTIIEYLILNFNLCKIMINITNII